MEKPNEVISPAPAWAGLFPVELFLALSLFSLLLIIVCISTALFILKAPYKHLMDKTLQHLCSVDIRTHPGLGRKTAQRPPVCPTPLWEAALLSVPTQGRAAVPRRCQAFQTTEDFQCKRSCSAIHVHNSVLQQPATLKYPSPALLCTTPLVLRVWEQDPSLLFATIHASVKRTESYGSRDKAGKTLGKLEIHETVLPGTKGAREAMLPYPGEHIGSTPAPSLSC